MTAASLSRATRQLTKSFGAQLGGKKRGPDHGEGRRVPRRNSYDVDDSRARPWRKVGDGSFAQGIAHREALLQAAQELYHQGWKEMPLRAVREARELHAAYSAELDALMAQGSPPIGRPAVIRQELGRLNALLERARGRLRRVDVSVLHALLRRLDFATGRLFPAIETIAELAGCHRNSVVGALRRLKEHGFINWVRRTVTTGNPGEFAPQREQTSNAYFFDHRRDMAPRIWQRYWQILVSKLRRLGAVPAAIDASAPREVKDPELRATLARIGASLTSAST